MAEYMDPKEVKKLERYKNYVILDRPIKFSDWLKDSEYIIVQAQSLEKCLDSIVGYVGVFGWEKNKINLIDGAIRSPNFTVYGYQEFSGEHIENGLFVLVKEI